MCIRDRDERNEKQADHAQRTELEGQSPQPDDKQAHFVRLGTEGTDCLLYTSFEGQVSKAIYQTYF